MVHVAERLSISLPCPNLVMIAVLGHPIVSVATGWLTTSPTLPFAAFAATNRTLTDNPMIRSFYRKEVDAVTALHLEEAKEILGYFDLVVLSDLPGVSKAVLGTAFGFDDAQLRSVYRVPAHLRNTLEESLEEISTTLLLDRELYAFARALLDKDQTLFRSLEERIRSERYGLSEYFLGYETASACLRHCGYLCHLV